MPTIHYIWWGPSVDAFDPTAVREVAHQTIGLSMIQVWCHKSTQPRMSELLSGFINIRVNGLPDHGILPSWIATKKMQEWESLLNADLAKSTSNVITHLTQYKAYSAVKDLLMLVLLYVEGGYYLDTTTFMAPKSLVIAASIHGQAKTLEQALGALEFGIDRARRYIPRFPRIGNLRQWDPLASKDPRRLMTSGVTNDVVMVADVDAWAAWSDRQSPYILHMLEDYVGMCVRLRLCGSTSSSLLSDKSERNNLIGALIINAIQTGLVSCARDKGLSNVELAGLMWTAARGDRDLLERLTACGADFYCENIGILKKHKGTWRQVML